jgi:hypothetical protein
MLCVLLTSGKYGSYAVDFCRQQVASRRGTISGARVREGEVVGALTKMQSRRDLRIFKLIFLEIEINF